MAIDIRDCNKINITDSCSIYNILSSQLLYARLIGSQFIFSITKFVEYECLHKSRKSVSLKEKELQERIIRLQRSNRLSVHALSISDLQDNTIQKENGKFGIGELSCIAFCKKVNQYFLTDDQGARKIGSEVLGENRVQTTPQLVGWLFYHGILSDSDLQGMIDEHNAFERPLEKYFRKVYHQALELRSMQ